MVWLSEASKERPARAIVSTCYFATMESTRFPIRRAWMFSFVGLHLVAASMDAATFSVTSGGDSGAGSLRQAVSDAAGSPGSDAIVFAAAIDGGMIAVDSEIGIADPDSVTIDASSLAVGLTLGRGASASCRLISVASGSIVSIHGLTFRNGGGGSFQGDGGAIHNAVHWC